MAHKLGASNTKNNRDSKSKRLGLKIFKNNKIKNGNILLKQKGLIFKNNIFFKKGSDNTLYSQKDGLIK